MKDNNVLAKKIKILYVVVIGLIMLVMGIFFYYQSKYNELKEVTYAHTQESIYLSKKINQVIELNSLNTEDVKYDVNPSNWQEQYKKDNGMNFDIPKGWSKESVIIRKLADSLGAYTIVLNKSGSITFDDFTKELYNKIYKFAGRVESFKEGKGYYEIRSFKEATYNNMYYDYMTRDSNGVLSGPRIKVKLLDLKDTNQVKIEVNKY